MAFIPKPPSREGIIIFGDGDEAVLGHCAPASQEGFMLFHFKPLPKMRWKKQIQDSEYDFNDAWVKRKYKSDLCIALSIDPDFPLWFILCDYNGKEETPAFGHLVRYKQLLLRKQFLEQENKTLTKMLKKKIYEQRQKALHGDAYDLEYEEKTKRLTSAFKIPNQEFPRNMADTNSEN